MHVNRDMGKKNWSKYNFGNNNEKKNGFRFRHLDVAFRQLKFKLYFHNKKMS